MIITVVSFSSHTSASELTGTEAGGCSWIIFIIFSFSFLFLSRSICSLTLSYVSISPDTYIVLSFFNIKEERITFGGTYIPFPISSVKIMKREFSRKSLKSYVHKQKRVNISAFHLAPLDLYQTPLMQ